MDLSSLRCFSITHLSFLIVLLVHAVLSQDASGCIPTPPSLDYLYTAYYETGAPIFDFDGPRGPRGLVAGSPGNFTGPSLTGEVLAAGGDFGGTDPNTGIFYSDGKLFFNTTDGAAIYVGTTGATQPDGSNHQRISFETADKRYYWLNDIVGKLPFPH